ncbi:MULTISPECIES: DUF5808 domain-containing protein [unclassified Flavobacterium]|uniref:DUF5808 domain-containing protein n=1 Tax=unclassified Flavobacterium TaxID=196869 RepID=UPI00057DA712|nr:MULTISPECIES: DUF5808 domain-containing protein [unclassified Flavobacterium]KIA94166.1 hypothetical protein OA93_20660 [Flavobacterium sp. KMS]OUL61748.1 hypothetical protein B8T70_13720 [Flavobacterium sp. AJR]
MERNKKPSKETKDNWHNDSNNWIWGIFYYNKEDKRMFPPKRNKLMGWTTNFANPNSVFILIIIIAILCVLGKYIK